MSQLKYLTAAASLLIFSACTTAKNDAGTSVSNEIKLLRALYKVILKKAFLFLKAYHMRLHQLASFGGGHLSRFNPGRV